MLKGQMWLNGLFITLFRIPQYKYLFKVILIAVSWDVFLIYY